MKWPTSVLNIFNKIFMVNLNLMKKLDCTYQIQIIPGYGNPKSNDKLIVFL